MERRDFIRSGLAAGISTTLPGVASVATCPGTFELESKSGLLTAHLIWPPRSNLVPLKRNGPATGIAVGAGAKPSVHTGDLHAVFAKEFSLGEVLAKATIRLFTYTRYRLYINGIYCGRGPSRFQNQRPEYDTRDISAALRSGRNLIAVLVHRDAPTGRIMRHEPGFAAVVHLMHESTEQTIVTDPTWRSQSDFSFGPRDEAWASIEEHIDARKGYDFTDPALSISDWPTSNVVGGSGFFPIWPRTTPLQSETRRDWSGGPTHWPIDLVPAQEFTFDLPEIVQGYHNIQLEADEGSELEIRYLLPEGAASGGSSYIARSDKQQYMGGDTFAFNRLSLRLKSGHIRLTHVEAVEVRYPFERVGAFECNDPFLNQLWMICARSLELLSEDAYVDCADRERVEWTDDSPPAFDCTHVMMRGPDEDGKAHWGDNRLLKALLRRIASTQMPDGQIKAHSCSERWDIHAIMEDRSCGWVVLLREYFESSGDEQLVKELWPTLTRLMRWFLDRRTGRGLVLAREWEVWDNPLRYQVCEGAGLNAMVYRALRDGAWLGNLIGEDNGSKALSRDADRLKADFNALLWNSGEGSYDGCLFGPGSKTAERLDGKMFTGPFVNGRYQPTVQAALFALYSRIVPANRVGQVNSYILSHLKDVQRPPTHYYLFQALYAMEDEKQDRTVLERMRVDWRAQVDSPWQTTWEEVSYTGGSKAHIYALLPGYFLTAFVLGARRIGPISERSILIEPRCAGLLWAKGIAVTEFGPVDVRWSRNNLGAVSIECSTPANTRVTCRLHKLEGKETLLIDQQPVKAQSKGDFIEVGLAPGKHVIIYPI